MAGSSNQDIQEIASEILDGLKDLQPETMSPAPITQSEAPALPMSAGWFFRLTATYPYLVGWTAFVALYFLVITILNPVGTFFLAATQTVLPGWIASLFLYSLLFLVSFFVFRFVIKIFVLPFENKS